MPLVPGQTVVVGRGRRANLVIADDRCVSSRHLLIKCETDCCKLNDLCSTNGTWVNQKKVTESGLEDGDEILAGRTMIAVSVREGSPDKLSHVPPDEGLGTPKIESTSEQDEPTQLDLSKTVYDRVTGSGLERLANALEQALDEGEAAKEESDPA